MQRHIIDRPKAPAASRRLAEFLRQDRAPRRLPHAVRGRGAARLTRYLQIARGRRA